MDVDAGRYNTGEAMSDLGDEIFALARTVASGQRTKGERAGHSQVQIWRDWQQVDEQGYERVRQAPVPDGHPLRIAPAEPSPLRLEAFTTKAGIALDRVGLVMPTSLCSGQIARLIAERLDAQLPADAPLTRFVALVHTEGCGSTNSTDLFLRTLLGHLRHPFVEAGLLLEHGCEQTHNDKVRAYLTEHGVDAEAYGWASIQLDGGLLNVGSKVAAWFEHRLGGQQRAARTDVGVDALRLALVAAGELPEHSAAVLAALAQGVVAGGGVVVVPSTGSLARSDAFRERLLGPGETWRATLAYGQGFERPGLHVMDAPTTHPTETVTGLASTGAQLVIAHVEATPIHAHPMVPTLQVSGSDEARPFADDLDLAFTAADHHDHLVGELERLVAAVASRTYVPHLVEAGLTDFQLTRGRLGVSV
jgi:altronate dehydratase